MDLLSKIFTSLFLPPGIFIIALLLAAIFSRKFKKLFSFSALIFYLLSNSYFSYYLLSPLEERYKKDTKMKTQIDKIVILGGGSIKESPSLPLSSDAFKRAVYGIMLSLSSGTPVIFTGGGYTKESDSFIEVMKKLEKSLHVKVNYEVEPKSLNTYENAKFTKKLLEKEGIENPKIFLVTSAYHTRRAKMIFENTGFVVYPKATDFKATLKEKTYLNLLPSMEALHNSYLALHEYIGFFKDYLLSRI